MASNPQAAMGLQEQVIVYRGEGYKPRSIGIRGCAGPMERDLWLVCVCMMEHLQKLRTETPEHFLYNSLAKRERKGACGCPSPSSPPNIHDISVHKLQSSLCTEIS